MENQPDTLHLTAEIVANYVANNTVSPEDVPALIRTVNAALNSLGQPEVVPEPTVEKPSASQIKKSIRPDALVSFVDGKAYKTLKRHLAKHGLTIADYKEKFGLPSDYPTTAPAYSAARSEMARSLGLGRQRSAEAKAAPKAKAPRKGKAAA